MDIVAPIPAPTYNVTAVVPVKGVDSSVAHNLLPQQIIQALVVEGGQNQIVLELGSQKLAAHTEQPLTSGQKLNLQVVSTDPQLKLQIVDKVDPTLLRVLQLFDNRSDLGAQLSKLLLTKPDGVALPQATAGTVNGQPSANQSDIGQTVQGQTVQGQNSSGNISGSQSLSLQPTTAQPLPAIATPTIMAKPASLPHEQLPVNLSAAKQNIDVNTIQKGGQEPVSSPMVKATPAALTSAIPTTVAASVINGITARTDGVLPIVGSAELQSSALVSSQWQQLQNLSTTLGSGMESADGRLVQNMARILGLDFEFLVNKDQLEQATHSLKGMAVALQDNGEVSSVVRENAGGITQQLEVMQLCRMRLAQDGILFLPLPFDFLQQGYVLFDKKPQDDAQGGESGDSDGCLVSLNLTLQQLGNMQVNLLFEQQVLYVRIMCHDDEVVKVVEEQCGELRQALQPFHVGSIKVTTGAEDPAVALLRHLQVEQDGSESSVLLDARV